MQESGLLQSVLERDSVDNSTVKFVYGFLLQHDFGSTAESLVEEAEKMGFSLVENKVGAYKDITTDLYKNVNVSYKGIPIVPNDRQIPAFMKGIEEKQRSQSPENHNIRKQYVQTQDSGVQTLHSNLCENSTEDKKEISLLKSHNSKMSHYTQELMSSELKLYNISCSYERLKLRFYKLHADYYKLLGVAGELTAALENSVKGEEVDLQATLEACIKIFPDLFNSNIRESTQISDLNINPIGINPAVIDELNFRTSCFTPKLLDFRKIKLHLINGTLRTKLLLLQALRWKITLARSGEQDEVIREFISNDLFGLHGRIASDNGQSVLPYLMKPDSSRESRDLRQSTARLLNALASFRCGRDYLSVGTATTFAIIEVLKRSEGIEEFTRDMLLATLQKLSLRKQQRLYMIKNGLVEWLICHLHSASHRMSSYGLEYATALLMNLSLHREARTKASIIASLVITTLISLLSVDRPAVLPYVNGALNNFLSNRAINEEAKKVRLSSILEYYHQRKTGELRKHFDHILKVHKREYIDNSESEDTADEDNEEFDVLENEIDEEDPVRIQANDLYGETLLKTCYSIPPSSLSPEYNQQNVILNAEARNLKPDPHKEESCLYFNDACRPMRHILSRESRETAVSSSMTLASARESRTTDAGKLSSIASL